VPLLILVYFGAQTILRTITPGGLGLDEAEVMVTAQSLEWGYGPQPPIYTYLQKLVFAVFGETKFGLSLLKNGLLALTLLALYGTARLCGASRWAAAAAGLSIVLIPQFSWEGQRDLTHSVLAVAIGACALFVFFRARISKHFGYYLLLGVLLGAGLLAKFNFIFFAVALIGVGIWRSPGSWLGMFASIVTAGILVAPFILWMSENRDLVSQKLYKFSFESQGFIFDLLTTAQALFLALTGYLALFLVVLLLAWWRRRDDAPDPELAEDVSLIRPEDAEDLLRIMGIALVLAAIAAFATGATAIKDRWLHPVLFALPLASLLWFAHRLDRRAWATLGTVIVIMSGAAVVALPIDKYIGLDKIPRQAAPFAPLARQIAANGNTVMASHHWLAGNLRLEEPGLLALTPDIPHLDLALQNPVQLVWYVRSGTEPPADLLELYRKRFGREPIVGPSEKLSAPYAWPHEGEFSIMRAIVR
jgi:4-amino-4-deoxy-L-arabinose transferase-like glycosyltransferase